MGEKKKILYIGNFSFPYGNAAGIRVLGNGYLFRELGYEVIYIGLDKSLSKDSKLKNTRNYYDNFRYYNLSYPFGITGWLTYKVRYDEVVKLIADENFHAVISYGSPALSFFNNLLRKWCNNNSAYYLTDCVDLLPSSNGSLLHRAIKSFDEYYQKQILNGKADGVIAISSYISNYYKDKKRKTVVIPPLVNTNRFEDLRFLGKKNQIIQLIYVGVPFAIDGRKVKKNSYKDRLDIAVEALASLTNYDFVFNIYGLTKAQYLSVITWHTDILKKLGNKVKFHGKIDNKDALVKIAESDFTILLRDVNEMTTAGFPTKFVETISCGTPIITTKTSDLEKYVKAGKNGYFVSIDNSNTLQIQLAEVLSLNNSEIENMKLYCNESKLFSYERYKERFGLFMESL